MKNETDHDSLKGSEEKYRALFEVAPVGISVINASRKILESNRILEKVVKMTREDLINGAFNQRRYFRPDGTEYTINELPSMRAINEDLQILDVEIGIADSKKIIGWIQVSAAPLNLPERVAVVVSQDITDRKNLEIKLMESEEKFRTLYENSIDAILLTGPDGTIYAANPAACKMFDRSEEEIIRLGRNVVVNITDPRLEPGLKVRELTGKFYGELTFIRKDGTIFPGELSSNVFTDSEGRQLTSMIIRDISE